MSENEQKDDILTLANGKTVQDIAEYDDGIDGEPEIIILVERED